MNFFKLYIGDYQRDTAHLSLKEHGAFLLMLQGYYATQKALPVGRTLHRMLRAQDKSERDAIDSVVAQFWMERDGGLVNERACAEIAKANVQATTNRAIAREREARRKSPRHEHESCTNRATNDQPNHSHNHNQKEIQTRTLDDPAVVREPTAAGRVCGLMRRAGLADANPGHPALLALLEAGASDGELQQAAAAAVERGKGFAYALGMLGGQRRDAANCGGAVMSGESARSRAARARAAALTGGLLGGVDRA